MTKKKTLKGIVVSMKMNKTVIVDVPIAKKHPRYGKRYVEHKRFPAHCEKKVKEGDLVTITESRPISKTKHWKVEEVLK